MTVPSAQARIATFVPELQRLREASRCSRPNFAHSAEFRCPSSLATSRSRSDEACGFVAVDEKLCVAALGPVLFFGCSHPAFLGAPGAFSGRSGLHEVQRSKALGCLEQGFHGCLAASLLWSVTLPWLFLAGGRSPGASEKLHVMHDVSFDSRRQSPGIVWEGACNTEESRRQPQLVADLDPGLLVHSSGISYRMPLRE